MPTLLIWSLVFVASLAALIASAEFFIKSAERVGVALGIPPFLIGVTVVALGTSLPELITSVVAVLDGSPEIVFGNVVGSNISNICLILGVLGVLGGAIKITFDLMKVDLPIMLGATMLLLLAAWDQHISHFEVAIFLLGITLYLAYFTQAERPEQADEEIRPKISIKEPIILIVTIVGLYFAAKYNVESIIHIAEDLGIGKELIALTAVALGTSLPELTVSIVAIRKNQADIAVGNIIGSNVFNIFAVIGIPGLFGRITVPESILDFSLPVLLAVSLLTVFIIQDKQLNRWVGALLLLFYVFFIGSLIG